VKRWQTVHSPADSPSPSAVNFSTSVDILVRKSSGYDQVRIFEER
jgi:hypothetical protein